MIYAVCTGLTQSLAKLQFVASPPIPEEEPSYTKEDAYVLMKQMDERCNALIEEIKRKSDFIAFTYNNIRKASDGMSSLATSFVDLRSNLHTLRMTKLEQPWEQIEWNATEDGV
jgi:hypothetical protein